MRSRDQQLDHFTEWLRGKGYDQHRLQLAEFPETGRGMMAKEAIQVGQPIVEIPRSLLITCKTPAVEATVKSFSGDSTLLSEHQSLALFLAHQRGILGEYRPYINLLPTHFTTVAALMPKEIFNHLPWELQAMASAQRTHVRRDYARIMGFCDDCKGKAEYSSKDGSCPNCCTRPSLTYTDFEWAWFAVNTRCITLNTTQRRITHSDTPKIALAPMLDFLNHTSEAKIQAGFDATGQSYRIRTLMPYEPGEQVFINYGPHDNSFLLAEYGFVLRHNPYNHVIVDRYIDEIILEGETVDSRRVANDILDGHGLRGDYTLHLDDDPSPRLTAALRIRVLSSVLKSVPPNVADMCWEPLVPEQERRVQDGIRCVCEAVLLHAEQALRGLSGLEAHSKESLAFSMVQQVWNDTVAIVKGVMQRLADKEDTCQM
ncbi:protein-lysine N-methyltransferase [Spizellomyces punctatus DAOM BR117]|uniref:SET domain-containing protein n=1 Tax=Spizellomyces punctatus (strain DAOM BR117) TaxID=645134 RepID=A0A0L0HTD0_SPIPD|nr:protein-lysine N-methyltransferase [Spizellomyces punctatus DAOM BR117]KND04362.1 hypothetical protein SPPG_00091 [Spizellomyces punctatus DAOM BR117]|eukprot:XP_016612401.1 hypothetical protein SPPG_00091 [Spizellomyces punctatus DAOM BR117]